jgi:pyridoxamine 5'-phosphate oxidase
MALATADASGRPSVRIVLLKGFDDAGAVFYTNYLSRKGVELAENPHASAVMLWHPLQRQVRIEGTVSRLDAAESDAYFASRPRGAQIGAVSSRQSLPVESRATLEDQVAAAEHRFDGRDVERPEQWGGYRLALDSMEFWQGRPNRVHDRLRYIRTEGGWSLERLQP